MKGTLYLVNRAHPLPEEPAAEDLASVRSGQTEVRLHQRAKVMLDQLLAAVDGAGTIIPVTQKVVIRNGMNPIVSFVKHYCGADMPYWVYSVKRLMFF